MNRCLPLLALVLVLALSAGGCSKRSDHEQKTPFPMPTDLAGVYGGSFPCADCTSIAATLWLRDDGRFFLRQSLIVDGGVTESSSYSFGHWSWDENSAEIVLAARGPERRLMHVDGEHLQLRTASAVPHVLERDAQAPWFADRVQLDGESTIAAKGGGTFLECATGLQLPIAEVGAYKELRRQNRLLNAVGKMTLTSVEAHIVNVLAEDSTRREVLVVDKVLATIKPGQGC
jgi:copper homeostasis protein (lipoprotein)